MNNTAHIKTIFLALIKKEQVQYDTSGNGDFDGAYGWIDLPLDVGIFGDYAGADIFASVCENPKRYRIPNIKLAPATIPDTHYNLLLERSVMRDIISEVLYRYEKDGAYCPTAEKAEMMRGFLKGGNAS